jgi:hypothetical protein
MRTALPVLIPFSVAAARSLGRQPRTALRGLGVAGLSLYLLAAAVSYALRAKSPREDLQGLAASVRAHHRPGDLVILFPGPDFGLRPYWPELAASDPLVIDPTQPAAPTTTGLRSRLDRPPPPRRVQLVYRLDFYFDPHHGVLPALLAELDRHAFRISEVWRKDSYVFLEAEAGTPPP